MDAVAHNGQDARERYGGAKRPPEPKPGATATRRRRAHAGFAEGTASMDDRRGMGRRGMDDAEAQGMEAEQHERTLNCQYA